MNKNFQFLIFPILISYLIYLIVPQNWNYIKIVLIALLSSSGFIYFNLRQYSNQLINYSTISTFAYVIQFILPLIFIIPLYNGGYIFDYIYDINKVGAQTILMTITGQLFFITGYEIRRNKININYAAILEEKYPVGISIVILLLVLAVWSGKVYLLINGAYYHSVINQEFMFGPGSWIYSTISNITGLRLLIICLLWLIYFKKLKDRTKNWKLFKKVAIIYTTFEVLWLLPAGQRGAILFIPITIYILHSYLGKKVSKKVIYTFIIASVLFLTIAKFYQNQVARNLDPSNIDYNQNLYLMKESTALLMNDYKDLGLLMFGSYTARIWDGNPLGLILDRFNTRYDFEYGSTYLNIFYTFLPRPLFRDKPVLIQPLNKWFPEIGYGSMPLTFFGEAYINFGLFGLIFIPIIFGYLIRLIEEIFIKRQNNLIWLALYINTITDFLRFTVEPSAIWISYFIKMILYGFILNLLVNFVSVKR